MVEEMHIYCKVQLSISMIQQCMVVLWSYIGPQTTRYYKITHKERILIPYFMEVDQCSFELTNTSLLLVDSSSLQSSLVFVPRIETVLEMMTLVRTKDMFVHSNVESSYLCLLISLPYHIYCKDDRDASLFHHT